MNNAFLISVQDGVYNAREFIPYKREWLYQTEIQGGEGGENISKV